MPSERPRNDGKNPAGKGRSSKIRGFIHPHFVRLWSKGNIRGKNKRVIYEQLIFYYAFNLFSPLFIHVDAVGPTEEPPIPTPPRGGLEASHVEHLQKVVMEVCHHDERKWVIQGVSS